MFVGFRICGFVVHLRKLSDPVDRLQRRTMVNSAGTAVSQNTRGKSALFVKEAFIGTVVVLILAPLLAATDVFNSYIPFLLLRLWVIGFALRRIWTIPYALMGGIFLFVWGLQVEEWALIDLSCAAMVAFSTLFLRTQLLRGKVRA
jgi:hypothetical protein